MRPSSPAIGISESTMLLSLATSRCRSRYASTGCSVCASRPVSASESVVYPVLIRLVLGRPSSLNSTSCSCLGEPRLNSRPDHRVGGLLGRLHLAAEAGRHRREMVGVGGDPGPLHPGQHADQRQLDVVQQPVGAPPLQVLVERVGRARPWRGRAAPGRPRPALAVSSSPERSSASCPVAISPSPLQLLAQVAQGQVGQVEGALAGQGEVGGERGVGGQPGQLEAAGGQGVDRALGVVHRLGPAGVGQPARQRPLVVLGERGRVEAGSGAVGGGQGQPVQGAGAAAPGAAHRHARCGRSPAACSASQPATSSGPGSVISTSKPRPPRRRGRPRRSPRLFRWAAWSRGGPAGPGTGGCRRAGGSSPCPTRHGRRSRRAGRLAGRRGRAR